MASVCVCVCVRSDLCGWQQQGQEEEDDAQAPSIQSRSPGMRISLTCRMNPSTPPF